MNQIRVLRAELGYLGVKQADAAVKLGIPVGRLSQLMNGRTQAKNGELIRLRQHLEQVRRKLHLPSIQEAVALDTKGMLPVCKAEVANGGVKVSLGANALVLKTRHARALAEQIQTAIKAAESGR